MHPRLKKLTRSCEARLKYLLGATRQRLRGPGTRTIRVLKISDGDFNQTNEAQFDPFLIHSRVLQRELGIVYRPITFKEAMNQGPRMFRQYDIVGLQFYFRTPAEEADRIVDVVRSRCSPRTRLVYFDGDDDLGILRPGILGKVDLYVKNHLMADRSFYCRSTIGKSNLTEYIATHYGTSFESDLIPRSVPVADQSDLEKVFLGWNLGTSRFIWKLFRGLGTRPRSNLRRDGEIDVCCRVTIPPNGWIGPFRSAAIRELDALSNQYRVVATTDRIPAKEFRDELAMSRICVSPFGHGEICFRDFEAVLNGCLLIKPDMGHLETRPNIYVPGETYVPVRWDFCDLVEKCRFYLEHEAERAQIAACAERSLRDFLSRQGIVEIFAELLDRLDLRAPHTINSLTVAERSLGTMPRR